MCMCVHSLIINNTPSQYIYGLTNTLYLNDIYKCVCVCTHSLLIATPLNIHLYIWFDQHPIPMSQQLCVCVSICDRNSKCTNYINYDYKILCNCII